MGFRKFMANESDFQLRAQQRAAESKVKMHDAKVKMHEARVERHEPSAALQLQHPGLLHQFTSHIEGKTAQVMIYAERIEWERPRRALSKKDMGTEMIPVKSMSSVITKRDGLAFTKVVVVTSGNTVEFRVTHADAKNVKDVLTQLILGKHPAQTAPAQAAPAPVASAAPSFTDRLSRVEALHSQGVLTDDEYGSKRAAILAEM